MAIIIIIKRGNIIIMSTLVFFQRLKKSAKTAVASAATFFLHFSCSGNSSIFCYPMTKTKKKKVGTFTVQGAPVVS